MVPFAATPAEKSGIAKLGSLVSHGEFAQALETGRPLEVKPQVRVWVDWAPVPAAVLPSYRSACESALEAWNTGLGGKLRFQATARKDDADVVFFFERSTGEQPGFVPRIDVEFVSPAPGRRVASAYIGMRVPGESALRDTAVVNGIFARSLGEYLGVGADASAKTFPASKDFDVALKLQDIRTQLIAAAEKHVALRVPQPVMHVVQSSLEARDVMKGEYPEFEFRIENKGDAPLEIEAKPGCGCTLVKYDTVIPAGAVGLIRAQLNTSSLEGKVTKSITVTGSDVDHPSAIVTLTVNVVSGIQFQPSNPPTLRLRDDQPIQHEMTFRIPNRAKTVVKSVTANVGYVQPTWEQVASTPDYTEYKVRMTIGTQAPVGQSSFLLTVVTGENQEIKSSVTIPCQKGIAISPPSLFLGAIGRDTALPVKQWAVMRRLGRGFKITKIDNDDPNLVIEQSPVAEGDGYRLAFTYNGGWAAGTISRSVVIHTDDPLQPLFKITVLAQVTG